MVRIGDFSKLSSISIRMLRHYDKMELLQPEKVDVQTGYRYYSAAQLKKANQIQTLKDMRFSLAAIKEILESNNIQITKEYFFNRSS
ncbi:merR regulatory family protein [Bacillus clarus]|uniref:MerR regulatory family protein n=1 Tax=Bacillus clarus TaxID=2338372 RepID=A0A090YKR3_9BACI|nr:merR regulatory family protein [Bacillus clarus]